MTAVLLAVACAVLGLPVLAAPAATAATASITGKITAGDTGAPLAGCVTAYVSPTYTFAGSTCADPVTGVYTFGALTAGTPYLLEVDQIGNYLSQWYPSGYDSFGAIPVAAPGTADLSLPPGVPVSGTLKNHDGTPASSFSVSLQRTDAGAIFSGYTAPDGTWSALASPGDYEIAFLDNVAPYRQTWAFGQNDQANAAVITVVAGVPQTIDDTIPAPHVPGSVAGTVVDAATGRPIAGICPVLLLAATPDSFDGTTCTQFGTPLTAADGSFNLTGVQPGTVVVGAADPKERYAQTQTGPITVADGQAVTGVRIRLKRAGALTGRVVDSRTGLPIAGACPIAYLGADRTKMIGDTTCSDADGRFRIAGIPPSTVGVLFPRSDPLAERWAGGGGQATSATRFTVKPGVTTWTGWTALHPGGTVSGRVTNAAGAPVAGAWVLLGVFGPRAGPGEGQYTAQTGADGRYTITDVPQEKQIAEVYVEQDKPYAWQWSGRATDPAKATPLDLRYATTTRFDVTLQPEATLTVTITKASADASTELDLYTASGAPVSFGGSSVGPESILVHNLPATAIKVKATSAATLAVGWYRGATSFATATPVPVAPGVATVISMPAP